MKASTATQKAPRRKPSSGKPYGTYLIRTAYSYCFRFRIPPDLRDIVGRTEIRYSLQTGYLGKAKAISRQLAVKVQRLCTELRGHKERERGIQNLMAESDELSSEQIRKLIARWVKESLKWNEESRSKPRRGATWEKLQDEYEDYDHVGSEQYEALILGRHVKEMGHIADRLLKEEHLAVSNESHAYHSLCRELLKACLTMYKVEQQRMYCDYSSGTDEDVIATIFNDSVALRKQTAIPEQSPVAELTSPAGGEELPPVTLKTLIQEYEREHILAGSWKEGTIRNYRPYMTTLKQYLGEDTQVSTISRSRMLGYKKLLGNLPTGFARLKAYKDISGITPESLDGKHDRTMDIATQRQYIQMAESLFEYGMNNGYLNRNNAKGLKPPKKKREREQRELFNEIDLQRLFHSKEYLNDKHRSPYQFWLPVVGLYTGCRLEELCQLYVEDVIEKDGIWCLDINSQKDKSIKNQASDRLVPLHPFLVSDLNFPGFVQKVKTKGHDRVFLELKRQSGNYGHYATKWFSRYKQRCEIDMTPGKKVFHSFRHNFTDTLFKNMVMETIIEELTGRAGKTETTRRYAKGYNIIDLYGIVCKHLIFPVDLSHLKKSRFVPSP